MTDETIAVLLATYNGEKFIKEQLQSIQNQSYSDWQVFIRDDGSTDETVAIVKAMSRQDERIHILTSVEGGGSAKKNFAAIHSYVKENYHFSYFMFCDQDDVWLPDKMQRSIEKIRQAEQNSGRQTPILVHTDLKVVDEKLNTLGESFMKYRALDPGVRDVNHLLAQNNVTGCTMLWNRALNDKINLNIEGIAMHDWWVSVSAALLGKIVYVDTPTILYRQHGDNTIGATKVNSIGFVSKRLRHVSHIMDTIRNSVEQAKQLLFVYEEDICDNKKNVIYHYSHLKEYSPFRRIVYLHKYHCYKQGLIQIMGQHLFVLFL